MTITERALRHYQAQAQLAEMHAAQEAAHDAEIRDAIYAEVLAELEAAKDQLRAYSGTEMWDTFSAGVNYSIGWLRAGVVR
jgi:hypothetical protein